jgi:predicted dehydrogenase
VDAVVVATPLSFHAEHEIAALASGRHVYGEKSLALTVEQCSQIRDAVRRSGRQFQIGAQFQYAPWYREAFRRIQQKKIGEVLQIYAYWHRNNNWRRPVPGNDPKLERLINWRMYREYSGGLPAELGSHHITAANTIFNGVPQWVVGSGGIDYWKDGREVPDNVQLTYRYAGGQTLFFSALTTNAIEGCQLRIYGTGGTIVLTQADATVYYEPKTSANSAVPEAVVMEHGIKTGASYRAEMPYHGPGEKMEIPENEQGNAEYLAVKSFVDCVRNNRKPEADIDAGFGSGVAVAIGNEAIEKGSRIVFADRVKQAQSAKAGA